MTGRPAKPPEQRRTRHVPQLGEWKPTPGVGWQHGGIPEPPDGVLSATREAWQTWMEAWFASHWTPADLPGLRLVIAQYDAVKRGQNKANDITTLVRLMDTYGITPAGQQSRRWTAPKADQEPAATSEPVGKLYGHLRAVNE